MLPGMEFLQRFCFSSTVNLSNDNLMSQLCIVLEQYRSSSLIPIKNVEALVVLLFDCFSSWQLATQATQKFMHLQSAGLSLKKAGANRCTNQPIFSVSSQTRLRYSIWGLLMLLRRYPGSVPDVDFMWDCGDDPKAFRPADPGDPIPFLFNYCKLAHSIDVPFPDWSFWGWPELQILPWQTQSVKIVQGGKDAGAWRQRKPTVS